MIGLSRYPGMVSWQWLIAAFYRGTLLLNSSKLYVKGITYRPPSDWADLKYTQILWIYFASLHLNDRECVFHGSVTNLAIIRDLCNCTPASVFDTRVRAAI